jgi:hypothetical protein
VATPYQEQFPVGTKVRVAPRATLELFRDTWHFHHPLVDEQLHWADREAVVQEVGFYHGGDVFYRLADIPGIWHESNLTAIVAGRAV